MQHAPHATCLSAMIGSPIYSETGSAQLHRLDWQSFPFAVRVGVAI
jgi:hypothetical protein